MTCAPSLTFSHSFCLLACFLRRPCSPWCYFVHWLSWYLNKVKSKPIGCVIVPPDLGDEFTQPWNQTFADPWVQMSPSQTFVKFKGCQNILFTLPWSKGICSADVEGIDPSTDDEIGEMLKISLPSPTHPFFTAQIVLMCKC